MSTITQDPLKDTCPLAKGSFPRKKENWFCFTHKSCLSDRKGLSQARSSVQQLHQGSHGANTTSLWTTCHPHIYLFIEGVNRTGSPQPQGFSQVLISHNIYLLKAALSITQGHLRAFHLIKPYTSWIQYKTCTVHKRKTYKPNPKVSPFSIALVKNSK